MKKAFLAASLFLLLALQVAGVRAASGPFPDVDADYLSAPAIAFLKDKGIISGYPDGTFKPENTINRAEALKLLFLARKALNLNDSSISKASTFPDIKSSDWFYQYVQSAQNLGIVQGYTDGYFKPANQITAGESLKIIFTGLITELPLKTATTAPFVNIPIDSWYAPYLEYGRDRQLIEPEDDGRYFADAKMTRAEFAEAIYRTMYAQSNKLDKYPLSLTWKYCNNYNLGYKVKRPPSWTIIPAGKEQIFWKKDEANGQASFARIYPNSAVAVISIDTNTDKLSLQQYIDQIEYGSNSTKQLITLNGLPYASIFIEQSGLQDSYFQMPNGEILIIYSQVGDGDLSRHLKEEIRYMIGSVRESKTPGNEEENCLLTTNTTEQTGDAEGAVIASEDLLKEQILKLILVDGKATEGLQKIDDEVLFETDSIGIGTGPVDYYYSSKLDLSIKIDRVSATILATKSGKTSAF